jgi:SAM-dependent methyltransferase
MQRKFILFVVCMCCNSALARSKPHDAGHMTQFYVIMATGGLVGSVIVTWFIPLISDGLTEYPLMFLATALGLYLYESPGDREGPSRRQRLVWITGTAVGVISCLALMPYVMRLIGTTNMTFVLIATSLPLFLLLRSVAGRPGRSAWIIFLFLLAVPWTERLATGTSTVHQLRNYYGIYRVYDQDGLRYLQHGTTLHGRQHLDKSMAHIPLSYYHASAPAGEILSSTGFSFTNVGMIGLGSGALAAYLGEDQHLTVFELDKDNVPIAEELFSYTTMARSRGATIRYVIGDGRLSLREEPSASFDLLILDAFNSGSIPVHLLTTEAIDEYFQKLRPDGLLLIHISNRELNLAPTVYSVAAAQKVLSCAKTNYSYTDDGSDECQWMILCRSGEAHNRLTKDMGWMAHDPSIINLPPPWTDKYSNLLRLMF